MRSRLLARAGDQPQRTAFVEGATGDTVTWAAVADTVRGWDDLARSVGPEGRVGLLAPRPLDSVAATLGALAAGVTLAPLDPGCTSGELDAAVARLGLAAVVGEAPCELDSVDRWALTPAGPGWVGDGDGRHATHDGSAALLMASSGTTGDPKLIPLTVDQLLDTAEAIVAGHGLGSSSRGYSPLPLFHINALVVGVVSNLVSGGCLVVDRRFSASGFWEVVARHEVTWLNLVPAIITVLGGRDAPDPRVSRAVGFARSASAPLPAVAREDFERRCGVPVVETYGMTEAASQICANPVATRKPGTVGPPVGVELRVVGELGEVQIRGSRVVAEYWSPGAPGRRRARDEDGWLATGDLGSLDADGYLTLVGRVDDVINRGGEKVFPREVEEVLLTDPAVTGAAVVGRPHPVVGHEPVAYVVARPDPGTADADLSSRLAALCEQALSKFKRPVEIDVVASLPTGPTGKVRHSVLRRALAAAPPAAGPVTFPLPKGTTDIDDGIRLPERTPKPRSTGLTMVIDGGQPTRYFIDAVASCADLVDVVKFGWGTALVTADLDVKIAALRDLGVGFYFGGTLFEKYVAQGAFGAFVDFVESKGCDTVEISNGTIPLTNTGKATYVRKCADRFHVLSEVGFKDPGRSGRLSPSMWVEAIDEDLEAGASMVITEARESGSSGICRPDGELRFGLVEDILRSGVDSSRLLWEAPTKALQSYFVTRVGTNVNLGNIAVDQVIGVETLRLGLRADTLLHVEQERAEHQALWEA